MPSCLSISRVPMASMHPSNTPGPSGQEKGWGPKGSFQRPECSSGLEPSSVSSRLSFELRGELSPAGVA